MIKFPCEKCDRIFNSRRALNAHQVAHKTRKFRYSDGKRTTIKELAVCKNCQAKFEKSRNNKNFFCSKSCNLSFKRKQRNIAIENGEIFDTSTMKRYLVDISNVCSECGISEYYNRKPIVLQCDHIDGNSDNNMLNNLRLLCPNCHSQTDTFGSKGKGNRYKKLNKRNIYLREYKNINKN